MKKITLVLLITIAFACTSSYAQKQKSANAIRQTLHQTTSLLTDTANTPEIASASISGDVLHIYILIPQGREPESLEIRSISGSWTGANLFTAPGWMLSYPYIDTYNRQCWYFQIPLNTFATPGDDYVLRFTDWTHTAADEVTVSY